MIKNRDIIVTGIQPWDIDIGSNCKNIAEEFSKHNRVLYVNAPLDSISAVKEKDSPKIQKRKRIIAGKEDGLVEIKKNMWNLFPATKIKSINWIKSVPLFDFFNKKNNKKFAAEIQKAIDRLGFKNVILFTDSDMFRSLYLKEYLEPEMWIYYIRDNLITQDYFKKHGTRTEAQLIAKADFVASNSGYLADYARKFNPNAFMVGQGCDLSMFSDNDGKIEIPDDIQKIGKPIIGYIGYLTAMRLDIEVLEHIAKSHPEWNVVLIGPEDDVFKNSNLHNIKNVIFFGFRQLEQLPGYIKGFDIALNPQAINELTIGNYPRKIDEYLAMGKPTMGTKTDFMNYFAEHCYLPANKEEYVEMIEKALKENNQELEKSRKAFANQHTWENNVKNIYDLIERFSK
ncbi:MAG: glycosyltransferase [Bacteroidota bacterium]|nr:glycosyltransferase [Bacteroidota bacterium]